MLKEAQALVAILIIGVSFSESMSLTHACSGVRRNSIVVAREGNPNVWPAICIKSSSYRRSSFFHRASHFDFNA